MLIPKRMLAAALAIAKRNTNGRWMGHVRIAPDGELQATDGRCLFVVRSGKQNAHRAWEKPTNTPLSAPVAVPVDVLDHVLQLVPRHGFRDSESVVACVDVGAVDTVKRDMQKLADGPEQEVDSVTPVYTFRTAGGAELSRKGERVYGESFPTTDGILEAARKDGDDVVRFCFSPKLLAEALRHLMAVSDPGEWMTLEIRKDPKHKSSVDPMRIVARGAMCNGRAEVILMPVVDE